MTEDDAFIDFGRGEPLVLLRGDDSDPGMWGSAAPLLAEAMRLIVPNASVASASDITTMLRDAGIERYAILAHGGAGPAAVELAARENVDVLVLIGGSVSGTDEEVSRLAEREIPVFLLWGEDDAVVPADEAERLSERLPTSTLALVPGAGNDVLRQAAATVVPLVFEYLRSRYLGERHGHADAGPVPIALTHRPDQS